MFSARKQSHERDSQRASNLLIEKPATLLDQGLSKMQDNNKTPAAK